MCPCFIQSSSNNNFQYYNNQCCRISSTAPSSNSSSSATTDAASTATAIDVIATSITVPRSPHKYIGDESVYREDSENTTNQNTRSHTLITTADYSPPYCTTSCSATIHFNNIKEGKAAT